MKYVILLLVLIYSCNSERDYNVSISSMDPDTKVTTEKVHMISAGSDSAAFKKGCNEYWLQKSVALEMNRTFEGSQAEKLPIPFYFSVESKKGRVITYSKEEAERLTYETVNYFQTKVIPFIDTITPIAKKPKSDPAKIY